MKFILILLTTLAFISCKKPDKQIDAFDTYNRKELLQNLGNEVIMKSLQNLDFVSDTLLTQVNLFKQSVDLIHLNDLKTSFKSFLIAFRKVEMYNFGPQYDNFFLQNVNYHIDSTQINSKINSTLELDSTFIKNSSSLIKGIQTLEYLLYGSDENTTLYLFSTDNQASRRFLYLEELIKNIKNENKITLNQWNNGYLNTFIQADSRVVNSSLSLMCNAIMGQIENIKNMKLALPMGLTSHSVKNSNLVENRLSQLSLESINANLQAFESIFLGKTSLGVNKMGIDDLLYHLNLDYGGANLADALKNKLNEIFTQINSFSNPLNVSIDQDFDKVNDLYLKMKQLIVLIKVDMMSQLGLIITYTDNDGD